MTLILMEGHVRLIKIYSWIELIVNFLPMLCFAFFFENILIPVSKAFVISDNNGIMGLKSTVISLVGTALFYLIVTISTQTIKNLYGDKANY